MTLCKVYGAELQRLRRANGLTIEAVAEQIDLAPQQIRSIEEGSSDISLACLEAFAKVYGVKVNNITRDEIGEKIKENSLGIIADIIDLFYANKHLYDKVNNEYVEVDQE